MADQLKPTPIKVPLKYMIGPVLNQRFHTPELRALKRKMILERTGLSESTWQRITAALHTEKQPLDAYDAFIIAQELGVEMRELLNPELL